MDPQPENHPSTSSGIPGMPDLDDLPAKGADAVDSVVAFIQDKAVRPLTLATRAIVFGIVVFAAASEAFSQRNINCSISESIERFAPVVAAARAAGIYVRGAMSCALGCPYEGEIAPVCVSQLAALMKGIGVQHIGVADTIGVGTPRKVQRAIEATLRHFDIKDVSCHFHDTYGQALANILISLQMGVWQFDASVAGLGGCPYAKGATGNVAMEDVVYLLHGLGIETGVDLDKLVDAGQFISDFLGRPTHSRAGKALFNKRQA